MDELTWRERTTIRAAKLAFAAVIRVAYPTRQAMVMAIGIVAIAEMFSRMIRVTAAPPDLVDTINDKLAGVGFRLVPVN